MKSSIEYPHLYDKNFSLNHNKLIYCVNVYFKESASSKYMSELNVLVQDSWTKNLTTIEENHYKRDNVYRNLLKNTKSSQSLFWKLKNISNEEKNKHDKYLLQSGYKNKIDQNAYFTEGCYNEKEVFIGGSKEFLNFYCHLFPFGSKCIKLMEVAGRKSIDNEIGKVFNKTELVDVFFDKIVSNMEENN
jgi:hypothetical protein